MEIFLIGLALLFLFILVGSALGFINSRKYKDLNDRLFQLEMKLNELQRADKRSSATDTDSVAEKATVAVAISPDTKPIACEQLEKQQQPEADKELSEKPALPAVTTESQSEETEFTKKSIIVSTDAELDLDAQISDLQQKTDKLLNSFTNWLWGGEEYQKRGVSREYAIATTWLIRLGLLTLLCGIGFFLKYSIDHNWGAPLIRVLVMSAAGIGAVVFGLWKRRSDKYRHLLNAIAGGGFVVLYLSVMAAYRLYNMLPSGIAFSLMIIITAAAMLASVYRNALTTAIIGCIGGFLTPVFIGNITADILIIHLTIMSAGVLFISIFKNWVLLNGTALFFYAILSILCRPESNALFFNSMVMLNFILYTAPGAFIARKRDITIIGMIFLSVNWALSYFNGVLNLGSTTHRFIPALFIAIPAIMAVILLYTFKLHKKLTLRPFFAGFLYLQASLSLAILMPELLKNAPAYALFSAWCLVAVALNLWGLFERSRVPLICGELLFALAFAYELYQPMVSTAIQSGSYWQTTTVKLITYGLFIAALAFNGATMYYRSKQHDANFYNIKLSYIAIFNLSVAFLLFAVYTGAEMLHALKYIDYASNYHTCIISTYWSILAALSVWCIRKINCVPCLLVPLLLLLFNVVFFLANTEAAAVKQCYFTSLLYMLFTGVTFTVALFFIGGELRKFKQDDSPNRDQILQQICFAVYLAAGLLAFAISSSELFDLLKLYLPSFCYGGLSVYWSILALALVFRGIQKRIQALRVSSIVLFILTVAKIFVLDLSDLQPLWRIIAFIIVGIVLLAGAIIYIRCKNVFIESQDDTQPQDNQ